MPIITMYQCDNCELEQDTPEQMWNIAVNIWPVTSPVGHGHGKPELWCRKCLEQLHLLPNVQHKKDKEELPPLPTFEELIREIVREEIQ